MPPEIVGMVDGLNGDCVTGWAYVEGSPETCVVEIFSEEGVILGRGLACIVREDLGSLGLGRSDFAYSVPIDVSSKPLCIIVTVSGVEITNSPIYFGEGKFDGGANLEGNCISGFITERAWVTRTHVDVAFYDQYGSCISKGIANLSGEDCGFFPKYKFSTALDLNEIRSGLYVVNCYCDGVYFFKFNFELSVLGHIDSHGKSNIQGWIVCEQFPRLRLPLELRCGSRVLARGKNSIPRGDLREKFDGIVDGGFELPFVPLSDDISDKVTLHIGRGVTTFFEFAPNDCDGYVAAQDIRSIVSLRRFEDQIIVNQILWKAVIDAARRVSIPSSSGLVEYRPFSQGARFAIVIPVYRGAEITRNCLSSVQRTMDVLRDIVVVIVDCSPEQEVYDVVRSFIGVQGFIILENTKNLGFVGTSNRGMRSINDRHIVLLNSDTVVYPGIWSEFEKIFNIKNSIGTITAMSNNATIFSYPHPSFSGPEPLIDCDFHELSHAFLELNGGKFVEVPTGHGFCLAIRHTVLKEVGMLDVAFGRGYGEENDLCARASDLGWKHVAAAGVFVQHLESVSFKGDRIRLVENNLKILTSRYPEYTKNIMEFEKNDLLSQVRRPVDYYRLEKINNTGINFIIVICHNLGGGTKTAALDYFIENSQEAEPIWMFIDSDNTIFLENKNLKFKISYKTSELDNLIFDIKSLNILGVHLHHMIGGDLKFIHFINKITEKYDTIAFLHDYYYICPRVTLLNSDNKFCGGASGLECAKCIKQGGGHSSVNSSVMKEIGYNIDIYRNIYAQIIKNCNKVIAPSNDTKGWYCKVLGTDIMNINVRYHTNRDIMIADKFNNGNLKNIIILGAIGLHKGSRKILDIADEAEILGDSVNFHVVGFTDIDAELEIRKNIIVHGPYDRVDLNNICDNIDAGSSIFLNIWPETFSYTLSEAWSLGLWPIVPSLGALSERVTDGVNGFILPEMNWSNIKVTLEKIANMRYKNSNSIDITL